MLSTKTHTLLPLPALQAEAAYEDGLYKQQINIFIVMLVARHCENTKTHLYTWLLTTFPFYSFPSQFSPQTIRALYILCILSLIRQECDPL